MDIRTAMAYHRMGKLSREELPNVATDALVAGSETQSLRLLAGLSQADADQSWDLFDLVVDELGLEALDDVEAARIVARVTAERASAGDMSSPDAIRWLSGICRWLKWQEPEDMSYLDDAYYLSEVLDERELLGVTADELERRCQEVLRRALVSDQSQSGPSG
jgi:hypothetical protein